MAKDKEIVQVNQALKGRGGKYNFPSTVEPENPEDVKEALGSVLYWYKRGEENKPDTDSAIQERIVEYLSQCYITGQRMTVEKLALALGITRETLWKWEQQPGNRGNMIKKAKDTIAAYDADMVAKGKLNPVPYIFRAKNYYGMKDSQDIVVTPNNPITDIQPEEVAAKYEELPD